MDEMRLRAEWEAEERQAYIRGWDFSHIEGRYEEEHDLPWRYREVVGEYLRPELRLLDYDTGGGELLLSLGHPYSHTAATEGYPPNVALCRERLLPLGIDFRECDDPAHIPWPEGSFDLILNRHGSFDAPELFRLLTKGGVFVTEQVGGDNDRDLVEIVLPGTPVPFPHLHLDRQQAAFEAAGFTVRLAEEARRPILFRDVGAFVWFARVLPWEFPGFSVERCFDRLLAMQRLLEEQGEIRGTIHRFLLAAEK